MHNWAKIVIGDSRWMAEVETGSVDLVVTSPPYWHLKDYGGPGQIGHGQSLHEYLQDLYRVWRECSRVLRPGGRLCVNVGDQFARAAVYGRYKIIPLHAEIIGQEEHLGFDFLGSIIWQKKTTMHTTGGAPVMGSYPFPPNGLIEIDYEFILIFKKPGPPKSVSREVKEASRLSREEWKEYFAGHWRFGGARQGGHEAMFPEELPRRLIRMFSFVGDTVLDPFVGSGTTVKAALDLGRNAWGYEINDAFLSILKEKLGMTGRLPLGNQIQLFISERTAPPALETDYQPRLREAKPPARAWERARAAAEVRKVARIIDAQTLLLDDGQQVGFLGVKIIRPPETMAYLQQRLLGRRVRLKWADGGSTASSPGLAYVSMENRLLINAYLIKTGLAEPDDKVAHPYREKFLRLHENRRPGAGPAASVPGPADR